MIACPFCLAELRLADVAEGGWNCSCGEFVPESMAVDPEKRVCGRKKDD